jgi:signal transduction histidine kinase
MWLMRYLINIRAAAYRLGIAYSILLLISLFVSMVANSIFHHRLAEAFSQSAHNSLVTHDLRQAVGVLNPSLNAHFSSVSFQSKDLRLLALPSERISEALMHSQWHRSISLPISTSEKEDRESTALVFTYPWTKPVEYLLFIWSIFLICAIPIFSYLKKNIEARHSEILALREAEIKASITSQVSHDIRSPLAALNTVISSFNSGPEEATRIAQSAINRINDIANDLLKEGSASLKSKAGYEATNTLHLSGIIKSVLEEKAAEFHQRQDIKFNFIFESDINIQSPVHQSDLKRILSNLINNSVEAMNDGGEITLSLNKSDACARIEIRDNGKGIPDSILKEVGRKGFSYDKQSDEKGGSGLGLYNALKVLRSGGADLKFESVINKGTAVFIFLPMAKPVAIIKSNEKLNAIIIDDDGNILELWKMVARLKHKNVVGFLSPDEFYNACHQFSRDVPIFIDVDLGENLRGEAVAEKVSALGFSEIFLATGYRPQAIRAPKCVKGVVGKEPIFL